MFQAALVLLEAEAHNELPMPAWVIGLIAFVLLAVMIGVTMSIGKGRPHS